MCELKKLNAGMDSIEKKDSQSILTRTNLSDQIESELSYSSLRSTLMPNGKKHGTLALILLETCCKPIFVFSGPGFFNSKPVIKFSHVFSQFVQT